VSLPADHPYVRRLRLQGLLTEIPADETAPAAEAASADIKPAKGAKATITTEDTTNAG
jgi:hypothetical protein